MRRKLLLAIDPGRLVGAALFDMPTQELVSVRLARDADKRWLLELPPIHTLVVELPHAGRGRASKADIITLAARAGAYEGMIAAANKRRVLPNEWKGSVPKAIMSTRIWRSLSERAQEMVMALSPPSGRHNAIDAIGLGYWALGTESYTYSCAAMRVTR